MAALPSDSEHRLALADEAATARLGAALARQVQPGDTIALSGPLGSGKTSLARAIIRALGIAEEVPSPTFTLVQTYESARGPLWHFDLYRLARAEEIFELGLEEAVIDGIILIEWPERLGILVPHDRLEVALAAGAAPNARKATLRGGRAWARRLPLLLADV